MTARPPIALVMALPACKAGQLSLGLDAEDGAFDGMSQSGTLLVFRNLGPTPCRTPALPKLVFLDAARRPLPIERKPPVGMHPGPVVPPVAIAPGAEATATLHWVSGDVYAGHHCMKPTSIRATLGTMTLAAPFTGQMCGPAAAISYTQTWLRTDPTLAPSSGGK
ncbi:MAG: DUF4232 domain-containing protein [Acidiphilium sp.]